MANSSLPDKTNRAFLVELSSVLSTSLDYQTTIDQIVRLALGNLGDWCSVDVLDADGYITDSVMAHADPTLIERVKRLKQRTSKPDPRFAIARVHSTGEPIFVPRVTAEMMAFFQNDADLVDLVRDADIQSVVAVPMKARGRVLGVLSLARNSNSAAYDEHDLTFISDVAHRMALHVDNAMLFRQAQQAQQRATLLAEITALLAESLDSADILQQLARSTVQHFADICVVYRLNAEGRFYRAALAHSDRAQESVLDRLNEFPIHAELEERLRGITTSGEPEFTAVVTEQQIQETPPGRYQETIRTLHPQSSILAPLTARGNRLGVIALTVTRDGRRYSTDDFKFVQDLAQRAAIAIDNERLYRELQHASRLKDDFLATLSHELRTPLTAIAGWAAVLKRATIEPKTFEQAVEAIHRNVALQAGLVDDLLDVSRIISGKMRLEVERLDLGAHISSWVETMRSAANAKSIQLELTVEETVGPIVCDPARIQQVVWNLLSNAIKFTPQGGKVQVIARTNEFQDTEIVVTDSGIGIASDFLPFVFDRFRQFDGSNTRRTAGLGLGLSIVRHLVELHGGTVSAQSSGSNQGATFRVVLPQMETTILLKERAVPL